MLKRMNTAYSSKACKFPLKFICDLIGGEAKEDVTSLINKHGISVVEGQVKFLKTLWKT